MSFQGRLLKSDGSPETGTPTLTFFIYAAPTGGDVLWSEPQNVPLTNGFYAVRLGAGTPFPANLFDGSPRWLAVQVGTEAELAPRQFIATVPYAFRAAQAASATSATTAAHASSADTATRATSADHATVADTATSATSADHASSADTLSIPGLVVGGYRSSQSSQSTWTCSNTWGNGSCSTSGPGSCSGGTTDRSLDGAIHLCIR
jgi:hypothetical protein